LKQHLPFFLRMQTVAITTAKLMITASKDIATIAPVERLVGFGVGVGVGALAIVGGIADGARLTVKAV